MDLKRASSPFSRTSTGKQMIVPNLSLEFEDLDASNEMYKQKVKTRDRRSFSPYIGALIVDSPDISPIELKLKSPRVNLVRSPKTPMNPNRSLNLQDNVPKKNKIVKESTNKMRRRTMFLELPSRQRQLVPTPDRNVHLNHRISVYRILAENNLLKYTPVFDAEEIDFQVFLTLTEKDFKDIGIKSKKDIIKFQSIINEFSSN